ncbi:MAG: hypothetical protein ACAI43_00405 [Phycisphaerae bacterium]|nr:hypothetical protein [Tepidisphaeraceae bacterium]
MTTATPTSILYPSDLGWRVTPPGGSAPVDVPMPDDASADQQAGIVARFLSSHGYRGQPVMVALPSGWCMAAAVSTDGVPADDRAALAFRLEEQLPVAAEAFTADFVLPTGTNSFSALGVAVPNDRVTPVVAALESVGITVQSVTPAAVLALEACLARVRGLMALRETRAPVVGADVGVAETPAAIVALPDEGGRVSLFSLADDCPTAWVTSEATPDQLELHLTLLRLELPDDAPVLTCGLPAGGGAWPAGIELHPAVSPTELAGLVGALAHDVLSGRRVPRVEFRRGALATGDPLRLHRRAINLALISAAGFFLVVAGFLFYRGTLYDRLATSHEAQLANEYRQAFGGQSVPPGVRRVVESELRKLTTAGATALPAEARQSALKLMRDVLSGVDAAAPVSFERLSFSDTGFEAEGRCKSPEDLTGLITASKAAGLEVPPPQMRKAEGNAWTFVLKGARGRP